MWDLSFIHAHWYSEHLTESAENLSLSCHNMTVLTTQPLFCPRFNDTLNTSLWRDVAARALCSCLSCTAWPWLSPYDQCLLHNSTQEKKIHVWGQDVACVSAETNRCEYVGLWIFLLLFFIICACINVGGPCAGGQPHVYITCNEIRAVWHPHYRPPLIR